MSYVYKGLEEFHDEDFLEFGGSRNFRTKRYRILLAKTP